MFNIQHPIFINLFRHLYHYDSPRGRMHSFWMVLCLLVIGYWLLVIAAPSVLADDMSSSSYKLQFGTFNMTSGTKSSASYNLTDTNGQTAAGFYGGTNNDVKSGFQYIYPFNVISATPSATPTASPTSSPAPLPSPTPIPSGGPGGLPGILSNILNILQKALIQTQLAKAINQLAPAVAILAPLVVTAAAVAETTFSFLPIIFQILSRLLQSLGLIPVRRPRGVVFDTKTGKPIAFVTITITRVSDNEIIDTVISDTSGIYHSIKLPLGLYRMEAVHSDYIFPTRISPKFLVDPHDFYRGETFEIKNVNQEELFLIPMDPLFEETVHQRAFYFNILLSFLRRAIGGLFYPMFALSLIITFIYPTPLNIVIVILYFVMAFYRYRRHVAHPLLYGLVIDRHGVPIPNTIVKCIESQTNQVSAILITDNQGKFAINLPPHQYILLVNKDGFVIEQPSQDYTNVFIAHTGTEGPITIHMMTVAQAFPQST